MVCHSCCRQEALSQRKLDGVSDSWDVLRVSFALYAVDNATENFAGCPGSACCTCLFQD